MSHGVDERPPLADVERQRLFGVNVFAGLAGVWMYKAHALAGAAAFCARADGANGLANRSALPKTANATARRNRFARGVFCISNGPLCCTCSDLRQTGTLPRECDVIMLHSLEQVQSKRGASVVTCFTLE